MTLGREACSERRGTELTKFSRTLRKLLRRAGSGAGSVLSAIFGNGAKLGGAATSFADIRLVGASNIERPHP